MKTCIACGETKPFEMYGKNSTYKEGFDHKCKSCRYELVKKYRATARGRASARATVRNYHQSPRGRLAKKRYELTEKGREKRRTHAIAHRIANPEKKLARDRALAAVRAGKITKQNCVICDCDQSFGHHEDYSKPLDLTWLCRKHHTARHKNEHLPLPQFIQEMRCP